MPGIKDEDRLRKVRDRLYARNAADVRTPLHSLTDEELRAKRKQAPRAWDDSKSEKRPTAVGPRVDARTAMSQQRQVSGTDQVAQRTAQATQQSAMPVQTESESATTPASKKPRRRYRIVVVIASLLILVAGATYTFFAGVTEISSRNITIDVSAPGTIGAGEEVPIDITIRNNNPVAVESGTLIVQFPDGSREPGESTRILRTDRINVDRIEPGAVLDIPIRAVIFGEEGEEKEVRARLDYRVAGTNSMLERTLDPIVMQVTSAPLSLQVDTTRQLAAGQEVTINLDVSSNAPNTLSDVLVVAEYPSGFEFIESNPAPAFGQNVWRIDELAASGANTVQIRGMFTGGAREEFAMSFNAGLPREDNRFAIGSIFATDRVDFVIEQPFFAIDLSVNNESGQSVAVSSGRRSTVRIRITNTLDAAVYDVRLAAGLSGNALDPDAVRVRDGFYDSLSNTVRFDVTTDRNLERIPPGGTLTYTFDMEPLQVGTAQLDVEFDMFARRTADASAQEQLVGQAFTSAQYTSVVSVLRSLQYDAGAFTNSGPVPPVAEVPTTYTVDLAAQAGRNDLLDSQVEFSLPTYVEWLDRYEGPGTVEFNPVNQQVLWSIGSIDADDTARLQFQIRFNPSRSQIGNTPVLINTQNFRATDRFTGVVVRDQGNVLSTELSEETGYQRNNGIVRSEPESLPEPEVADDAED